MTNRPNWKQTFTLVKRLADIATFGKIAQLCGKEIQTAEAWGRAPESNAEPLGTGKKNPLDMVLRLIALAHKENPGLAREIADTFGDYVNYLDSRCGEMTAANPGNIQEMLGRSAKEHTDMLVEMLQNNNPNLGKIFTEYKQAESALLQFGACLKETIKIEREADGHRAFTRGMGEIL